MRLPLLLALATTALATSVRGNDVLLVYDDKLSPLASYTELVAQLTAQGLTVATADASSDVALASNGVFNYQHLLLLPSKQRKLAADISGAQLVDFFNSGGDIVALTSPVGCSESVRTLLNELGVFPSPRGYDLVDHFEYDLELGQELHNVLKLSNESLVVGQPILSTPPKNYQGSSALLNNNPMLMPLLQAPTTSYTKTSDGDIWTVGKQGYLAASFQGLNDARVSWVGDANLFSNQFLSQEKQLVDDLVQWTFSMKNVLKAKEIAHYHVDGTSYEERPYKVKDEVHYEIELQEWDGSHWVPYITNDMQLDVKLLDPYHRLNLSLETTGVDSATYGVDFILPEQHGVFSFQVDHRRPGFTSVEEKNILSVRHLANDEFPRSWEITNSWVYITSSIVVFCGWFVFVMAFIYARDETSADGKKEK